MSRRTAQASKAVRDAWKEEQERVRMGKGTRDWTQEQQKEILELGRAYYHSDDPNDIYDGKAFEGHHMKSVEAYPEFQGDSANIQFLSKPEHIEAHRGDYKIASNWYFDPVTHEFTDFGEGKYIPCTVIDLSDPIFTISIDAEKTETEPLEKVVAQEHGASPPTEESKKDTSHKPTVEKPPRKETSSSPKESKKTPLSKTVASKPKTPEGTPDFWTRAKGSLSKAGKKIVAGGKKAGSAIVSGGKTVGSFVIDHMDIIAPIAGAIGSTFLASKLNDGDSNGDNRTNKNGFTPEDTAFESSTPEIASSQEDTTADDISPETTDRPYTPNDVPEGKQRYHYADGSVRERGRAAYSRGKKKDNTNEDDEEDS